MADEPENLQERAAKLREELRNGRRGSAPANATSQDAGNSDSQARGSIQVLPGESQRTEQGYRLGYGPQGRLDKEPERVGPADRRSSNHHKSTDGDVHGPVRRAGRLVADGPIPDRFEGTEAPTETQRYREDYKRTNKSKDGHVYKAYYLIGEPTVSISPEEWQQLKSRKQERYEHAKAAKEASKAESAEPRREKRRGIFGFGKEGSVLSKSEVNALREPFTAALKDDCKYLDEFLAWYSKDPTEPQIWSDLDDEEIAVLATVFLHRGERNPAAATFVRNVVDSSDYISFAVIVAPRAVKSMQQMGKRPKQPRKPRGVK